MTTTGAVKATPELVTLALCDSPNDEDEQQKWDDIIDRLLRRNVITHRWLWDELRLWEGSDFNVDAEVAAYSEQERSRSPVKFLSTALFILRHKPNISE